MVMDKRTAPIERDEELEEMLKFMRAAVKATEDRPFSVFICPICRGAACAEKSPINGHVHASCDCCGMRMTQ